MKDAVATMGNLLPKDASGRDAVHVAVFSAHSKERLFPSQHVAVVRYDGTDTEVGTKGIPIGIVDPFLRTGIPAGERFWCYLYPRTIKGLSHRWSHPAFDEQPGAVYASPSSTLSSEEWIRDFAKRVGLGYSTVMSGAHGWLRYGECLCFGDLLEGKTVPDEFWDNFERVAGMGVKKESRGSFFRCSC